MPRRKKRKPRRSYGSRKAAHKKKEDSVVHQNNRMEGHGVATSAGTMQKGTVSHQNSRTGGRTVEGHGVATFAGTIQKATVSHQNSRIGGRTVDGHGVATSPTGKGQKCSVTHQNNCVEDYKVVTSSADRKQVLPVSGHAENPLAELSASIMDQTTSSNQSVKSLYEEASAKSKSAILAAVTAARVTQCTIKTASAAKLQKEWACKTFQEVLDREKSDAASREFAPSLVKKLASLQARAALKQEKLAAKSVEAAVIEQTSEIANALAAVRREHIIFTATVKALWEKEKAATEKNLKMHKTKDRSNNFA